MNRIALLSASLLLAACSGSGSARVNGTVDGTYRIDGQDARLKYCFVAKGDKPWNNQPTYMLVFTEQDASAAPRIGAITVVNTYGAALVLTAYDKSGNEYSVIGEDYHHPGLKMPQASGTGTVFLKNVSIANGEISGEAFTKPDSTMFGQKVEIDLKFKAPMPK